MNLFSSPLIKPVVNKLFADMRAKGVTGIYLPLDSAKTTGDIEPVLFPGEYTIISTRKHSADMETIKFLADSNTFLMERVKELETQLRIKKTVGL